MHIILSGKGQMAAAVKAACAQQGIELTFFDDNTEKLPQQGDRLVAIHFGSGNNLLQLLNYCERLHVPLIQGSTKLTAQVPAKPKTIVIDAPNLSLPIVRFMHAFPDFAKAVIRGTSLSIVESHQATKKDLSGTARAIANSLIVEESKISSVRDPAIQLALGVPAEHLDGHAYHYFTFRGPGVTIELSTKVHGRATYAEGAIMLAKALASWEKQLLTDGRHRLKDLMHLSW